MSSTDGERFGRFLVRVGAALRAFGQAHEELWTRLETMDPRPGDSRLGGDDLHWEPTASGWRLCGSFVPRVSR
ncbi:hypothetical protein [Pseudonocardia phyllosphaerae]|uniref:hypothetical protein n=1 Tax=Pseudonocardia phyllosphaerae TaxID=3390502 RepID=UPI00397C8FF8